MIKRANDAGVILVAFDNILDTEDAINVNVDQKGLGVYWADWLVKKVPNGGKILEVRGVSGTSVDRDRHDDESRIRTRPVNEKRARRPFLVAYPIPPQENYCPFRRRLPGCSGRDVGSMMDERERSVVPSGG